MMNKCNHPIDLLTRKESKVLKKQLTLTIPIKDFINEISGANYLTSSFIISLVYGIKHVIESINLETEECKSFQQNIFKSIKERF